MNILKKYKFAIILVVIIGAVSYWFSTLSPSGDTVFIEEKIVAQGDAPEEEGEEEERSKSATEATTDFKLVIDTEDLYIESDIVRGVTDEILKEGVGRHVTTGYPNTESGNMVLSGHRWYPGENPNYTVFEDLDKLKNGDRVSVFHDKKEYIYEIFEDKIVSSDSIEILEQTEEPQLTLYTCTPKFTSLKRLVYIAKFVEVKNAP